MQVERALVLVESGAITIATIANATSKTIPLPKSYVQAVDQPHDPKGKSKAREPLTKSTAFSEAMWGEQTRLYAQSAAALESSKFDEIIRQAKEFVVDQSRSRSTAGGLEHEDSGLDEEDERAALAEGSDTEDSETEDDCKSLHVNVVSLLINLYYRGALLI